MTERDAKARPDWWPGQDRYERMFWNQQKFREDQEWARGILAADKARQAEQAELDRQHKASQHRERAQYAREVARATASGGMYPMAPTSQLYWPSASGPSSDSVHAAERILRTATPPEPEPPNWTDWIEFIPVAMIVGIWLGIVVWGMVGGWQMAAKRDGVWYDYVAGVAFGGLFFGFLALIPVFIMGALCSVGEARR